MKTLYLDCGMGAAGDMLTVTKRYVLDRKLETVQTPYGDVRRKVSSGYGVSRVKYEYDDLSRIAKEHNISLDEVRREADNAINIRKNR